jgi:hypothetical protein
MRTAAIRYVITLIAVLSPAGAMADAAPVTGKHGIDKVSDPKRAIECEVYVLEDPVDGGAYAVKVLLANTATTNNFVMRVCKDLTKSFQALIDGPEGPLSSYSFMSCGENDPADEVVIPPKSKAEWVISIVRYLTKPVAGDKPLSHCRIHVIIGFKVGGPIVVSKTEVTLTAQALERASKPQPASVPPSP